MNVLPSGWGMRVRPKSSNDIYKMYLYMHEGDLKTFKSLAQVSRFLEFLESGAAPGSFFGRGKEVMMPGSTAAKKKKAKEVGEGYAPNPR